MPFEHDQSWELVSAWAESSLRNLHEEIENPLLTEVETAVIRGEIKMFRELLQLPKDSQEFTVEKTVSYID